MPADRKAAAALSQLATDIADITRGYEVMEEKADAELRPVAQRLHTLHETHAREVSKALADLGRDPGDSGSLMGAVHRAVVTGRDWFGALDRSALPQVVSGEERLLSSYDAALDATRPEPEVHTLLLHQRRALQSQIDALKRD
ncbi:MAG: DUF2383 domain-containing protein [Roseicyclus sp.]